MKKWRNLCLTDFVDHEARVAPWQSFGLGTRSDRAPRMASACKSPRECERWQGEILQETSRKVSKIQDGL
jgi:pre-mRNA-splicing factor ISY1